MRYGRPRFHTLKRRWSYLEGHISASPSNSPSMSHSSSPSSSESKSLSPSASKSPSSSVSPSISQSKSLSPSASVSSSVSKSLSPSASVSPSVSKSLSPSSSMSPSVSLSLSPSGSESPSSSVSPSISPSFSLSPSGSLSPSASPSPECTFSLFLQPDGTAGVDAYISALNPTTNYETDQGLFVGEMNSGVGDIRSSLLKFDLSSIPANAVINSAVLSLWLALDESDNARTARVYRQKRAWVESQVTWNVYSTGNSWQTAGGVGSDDIDLVSIGSHAFSASEANGEKQFLLTAAAVEEWVSGAFANNGLIIVMDTQSDDGYQFRSSDYVAFPANRPQLAINYTTCSPSASRSKSPSSSPSSSPSPSTPP